MCASAIVLPDLASDGSSLHSTHLQLCLCFFGKQNVQALSDHYIIITFHCYDVTRQCKQEH